MHFLIWETLSSNLMYVAACYFVGTGMCHNMVGPLQRYYRHIKKGVSYVNKPFYELLSEKKINHFFTSFKIITLFHHAFCYETAK